MNTMKTAMLAVVLLCGASVYAGTPRVDERQERQEERIDQGVASGELTAREANRLEARQEHIDNVEDRALADGVVTRRERVKLEVKQDRNSRAIARQKHDRQDRD